jgi:hypothetical protein
LIAPGKNYIGASLRQSQGNLITQSAGRAGDHNLFSCLRQILVRCPSLK